ncbi:hypothetical protein NOF04DRAFT_1173561 [Fusarium oxysporum II5]|nr:hypothetical protein NOF04DRAFT_1173561 [Fusarium oxysporum II5]
MHLVRYHMRIPYCPKCSKTFETVAKCDTHIIKGKCKAGPLIIPDGINYYQKSQLKNKTKSKEYTDLRPEQRWKYTYKLVFPESQSYPSATMDTEGEKRVLQARVFWQAQGRKYVTEYCQTGSGFEIEDVQELGRTFRVSKPMTMFFSRIMAIPVQNMTGHVSYSCLLSEPQGLDHCSMMKNTV